MSKCGIKRIDNGKTIVQDLIQSPDHKPASYLKLPRNQQLTIVRTALSYDIDQQTKEKLEAEQQKLEKPIVNSYYSNVNRDSFASINISNPSVLVSFLSPALNQALYNNTRGFFTKLVIGDYNNSNKLSRNLCFDDISLNENIKQAKINLLNELCSYVGVTPMFRKNQPDNLTYSMYVDIMSKVAEKLKMLQKQYTRESDTVIDKQLSQEFRQNFFNALQNYFILTNFDDFCEAFGAISLNAAEKGKILSTESIKYSLDSSTFFNPSFADDIRQNDGEKTVSNFLRYFITSIQKDNGSYVPWNAMSLLATTIHHDAEENPEGVAAKFLKNPDLDGLIECLSSTSIRNRSTMQSCDAIAKALTAYNDTFNIALQGIKTASRLVELQTSRDVVAQAIHYITSTSALTYVETKDDETVQKTTNKIATSKQAYLNLITGKARENFRNHAHNLYQVGFKTNDGETFNQLFSTSVLNYLHDILGFSLENLQSFFAQESTDGATNALKLATFVSKLQKLYQKHFSHKFITDLDSTVEAFKTELATSGEYIDFVNVLIDAVDRQNPKIIDQNGNTIPGQGIFSHLNDFDAAKDAFKQQFGDAASNNILVKKETLTRPNTNEFKSNYNGHTCYRSDVLLGGGTAISPVLLTANETMTLWLNKDFLESVINQGILYLQPEGFSDKPRLAVDAYNQITQLLGNEQITTTTEDIVNLIFNQNQSYYQAIEEKICAKWEQVFNAITGKKHNFNNNIGAVIEAINTAGLTFDDVHDALLKIQQTNPNFNFIKDSDFIIDKSGRVGINRALCFKIATAKNRNLFDQYYTAQLSSFHLNLAKTHIPTPKIEFKGEALMEDGQVNWNRIYNITGSIQSQADWIKFQDEGWHSDIAQPIIDRYFAIQTLLKEAELQIGIKHPWCHDVNASAMTKEEYTTLLSEKVNITNKSCQDALAEYNTRLIKGKKRNSFEVVTFTPMHSGSYGVSPNMRIAVCQFPMTNVTNHFGISDALHPHDGATFVNPIWSIFEENSYPGKKYLGSRKTIGLQINDYSVTQIKHAEYTMNNAWIRGSFNTGTVTEDAFNGEELMRCMLSPAKLGNDFFQNWSKAKANNTTLRFEPIIFNFNGEDAYLDRTEIVNRGTEKNPDYYVEFHWNYYSTDEEVPNALVMQRFDANIAFVQNDKGEYAYKINNVFQLWQALGGAYCKTEKNDVIDYSDTNNEMIATLISKYCSTNAVKESMIAKICDAEAVKSGALGFNSANDVRTGNLVTGTFKTKYFGIQQDYTHLAEDSDIPALTQVITAIAFNGNNIDLVNRAYLALGEVVEKSLRRFTNYKSTAELQLMLGERLYESLKKNAIASNAVSLVQEFLQDVNKEDRILPVSNPDLFYKIASDIISNLNANTIKQKFKGIAVIQNPSQGIVGLYEDVDGNVYTRTDILKLAEAELKENNNSGTIENILLLSEDSKIRQYFERHFDKWSDEKITSANFWKLAVGDNVKIGDQLFEIVPLRSNKAAGKITFNEIKAYLEKEDVRKVHNRQRNLKCHNITFKHQNGGWDNLFCLNSFKALLDETTTSQQKLLNKKWHRANLKMLQDGDKLGNRGYYATFDAFKRGILTIVDDVKDELGEQVIPKVHSEFNLGKHSLSEIRDKGSGFFKADIQEILTVKTRLKAKKYEIVNKKSTLVEKEEIGLATTGGEIIFTQRKATEVDKAKQNVYLKRDGDKLLVVDPNDNFLCYAPTEIDSNSFCGRLESVDGKRVLRLFVSDATSVKEFVKAIDNRGEKVIQAIWHGGEHGNQLINAETKTWKDLLPYCHGVHGNLESSIDYLSKAKYQSWLLTLKTISARIPSQSFQSFLATRTVAYTEDDFNNGYMNIWEMWFQGSDFDIDKAYTLLFDVSKNGLIQGNAFTDYSSADAIEESLKLTAAQNYTLDKLETPDETYTSFGAILTRAGVASNITFDDIMLLPNRYKILDNIINGLNTAKRVSYTKDNDANLVQKLINYKNQASQGFKNKITEIILEQSRNLNNLEASEQPMSAKPIKDAINKAENKKLERNPSAKVSSQRFYFEWNPFTIARIQQDNCVGKQDVGIAANGMKAAGALQQYFNEMFKNSTTAEAIKHSFRLDLQFDINSDETVKPLGEYSFTRLANTVMDQYTFNAIFDSKYDATNPHPYAEFFNALKRGASLTDLTENEQKLKNAFDAFKLEHNKREPINLKELLYYSINFEDNVADNLSVFISLATDNAKELQLARIYGTPELLSMPLAMLTLGIDVQTTMDICVEYLGKVADLLETNRFVELRPNVRKIIDYLDNPEIMGKDVITERTKNSLLKIYDFAQELRTITSFFKVNQGVETRYAKLKAWFDGLTLSRTRTANIKNIVDPRFQTPFDVMRFFSDADYQAEIVNQYEELKEVINIGDIILKSPHFAAQLHATAKLLNQFESISSKAHLAEDIIRKANLEVSSIGDSESLHSKAFRLIDDWVIGQYLKSNDKFQFVITGAQNGWDVCHEFGSSAVIKLSTSDGIRDFVSMINAIIPKLQAKYPDNLFLKGLVSKYDKQTEQNYYDFNVDPYAVRDDDSLKEVYNVAISHFDHIRNNPSMITSVDGTQFSIGELLYLYGVITSKGKTTGFKTITNAGKRSVNLNSGVESTYENLDRLLIKSQQTPTVETKEEIEIAKQTLSDISTFLNPYLIALMNDGTTQITLEEDEQNDRTPVLYDLSVNDGWVSTFKKVVNVNETIDREQLLQFLNYQYPLANFTLEQVGDNKFQLYIQVTGLDGVVNKLQYMHTVDKNSFTTKDVDIISETIARFVDSCAPYLNDTLQQALSTPTTVAKILQDNSIDFTSTSKTLQDFLQEEKYPILIKQNAVGSYATEIAGEIFLVIDRYDFTQRSGGEHNPELALLNLYAQTELLKSGRGISEQERIDWVIENAKTFKDLAITKSFKTVADKARNLISRYVDYLAENSEIEVVKTIARNTVFKYENVILSGNKELYYTNVDKNSQLEYGDLVGDGQHEYLYVADTRTGQKLFVTIDGAQLLKTGINVQTVKKLLTPPNTFIKSVQKLPMNETTTSLSIDQLYPGCQVLNNATGDVFMTVRDVLVKKINNRIYHRVIAESVKGLTHVLDKLEDGSWALDGKTTAFDASYKVTAKTPSLLTDIISAMPTVTNDTDPVLFNYLNEHIQPDFIVETNSGSRNVVINTENNQILTNNGVVQTSDIIGIQYKTSSDFFNQVKPVLLGLQHADFGKDKHGVWHPELANGYFKLGVHKLNMQSDKFDAVILNGKTEQGTPMINCLGLTYSEAVTEDNVKVGDYIESRAGNTTGISKVIDKVGNNFATEFVKYSTEVKDGKTSLKKTCGVAVVTADQLIKCNSIKLSEKPRHSFLTRNDLTKNLKLDRSEIEICHDVISRIQSATHLPVTLDSTTDAVDENGKAVFAKATDSGITIYLHNKPKNVTVSNFIISQCAHEFTHMLLYALKAQSPEVYLRIINWASPQLKQHGNDLAADVRMAEEFIVDIIQGHVDEEIFNDKEINSEFSFETIRDIIQKTFQDVFNCEQKSVETIENIDNDMNFQHSLISLLQNYGSDFVTETTTGYNMNSFRRQIISNSAFGQIQIKC